MDKSCVSEFRVGSVSFSPPEALFKWGVDREIVDRFYFIKFGKSFWPLVSAKGQQCDFYSFFFMSKLGTKRVP